MGTSLEREPDTSEALPTGGRESRASTLVERSWNPLDLMNQLRALRARFGTSMWKFPDMRAPQLETMKREHRAIAEQATVNGVSFENIVPESVWEAHENGSLEIEGLNLYMEKHGGTGNLLADGNLDSSDEIGFQATKMLADLFPRARQVLLVDDVHSAAHQAADTLKRPRGPVATRPVEDAASPFSPVARAKFRTSIVERMKQRKILRPDSAEGQDYLLISESSKKDEAPEMVRLLEGKGYIERNDDGIFFVNPKADNPEFSKIKLAGENGRWLCVALDAASFLKPENLTKTHLVVLDSNFKSQQDQVWEILRILGIQPLNYHNIFFDPARPPAEVVETMRATLLRHRPAAKMAKVA